MPGSETTTRSLKRSLAIGLTAFAMAFAGLAGPGGGGSGLPAAHAGVTNGSATSPDIAMNKDGDAIAIWVRAVDGLYRVEARYRPAGGSWGEVKTLAPGASGYLAPHVAIDEAGNASAIWYRSIDGFGRMQTARRSAGGTWGAVKTLSPAGVHVNGSDIVMDADGDITAAWNLSVLGGDDAVQAARRPKGGSWSSVDTLSPTGEDAGTPVLATTPDGTTMAAWTVHSGGVKSVRRPAGGDWGAVVPVTAPGATADFVDLAMDAQGRAIATWRGPAAQDGGGTYVAMHARRRTAQGWGPIAILSAGSPQASSPGNVAMSAAGDAYVVWGGVNNGHNRALAKSRPASGDWGPLVKLGPVGQSSDSVRVAVNARGDAVAVWNRFFGDTWIEASFKPAGQDWGLAREVSEAGRAVGGPIVALGNDRTALVLFLALENGVYRIQTVTRSPGGGWSDPVFLSPLN